MLPPVEERIAIIRGYLLGSEMASRRQDFRRYADAVSAVVCPLAHVGISVPQALDLALETADQIQGCEPEIDRSINGVHVRIVAAEPLDERTDVTQLLLDGRVAVTVDTHRGALVHVETDHDVLERYSTLLSPQTQSS